MSGFKTDKKKQSPFVKQASYDNFLGILEGKAKTAKINAQTAQIQVQLDAATQMNNILIAQQNAAKAAADQAASDAAKAAADKAVADAVATAAGPTTTTVMEYVGGGIVLLLIIMYFIKKKKK
jgi:hypothetical protein